MSTRRVVQLVLAVLVFVVCVSHVGPALLCQGRYLSGLTFWSGLALTIGIIWILREFGFRGSLREGYRLPDSCGRDLVLLLVIATMFRFAPLPNIAGGRDDGVYANMAAYLTRETSVFHRDPTIRNYPEDGREFYAAVKTTPRLRVTNRVPDDLAGRLEGNYLPGVYVADARTMTYVFQFAHVHPIWMSLTAALLGLEYMGYAVILFGLATVLVFYLLVHGLTEQRRWALVAGLFLAANPLHAFFSKNTLSEPIALFFSLASLLMMVWAWRLAGDQRQRWVFLLLAVGLFSALCLTRIDGFFFLPFAVCAVVYVSSLTGDRGLRRTLALTLVATLAVYALSVVYLRTMSFPYAHAQYEKIFGPLLGPRWRTIMPALLAVALIVAGVVVGSLWRSGPQTRWFIRIRPYLGPAVMLLMLAALAVHGARVFKLATGTAADQIGYIAKFDLAGHGWKSVNHSSLLNAAIYVSPPVFGLFLWQLGRLRDRDHLRTLLLLLVAGYFVYAAVLQWVLPYQYYYGRYLLAGVVPYIMLLVFHELARRPGRQLAVWALLGFGLLWSGLATATQYRFNHYGDLFTGLGETIEDVDRADLILWDQATCGHTLYQTPLIYTFDRNVWTFAGREELETLLARSGLLSQYADVFVVSTRNYLPDRMQAVDQVSFEWARANPMPTMPVTEQVHRLSFRKFRVDKVRAAGGQTLFFEGSRGSFLQTTVLRDATARISGRVELTFDLAATDGTQLDIHLDGWQWELLEATASASASLNGYPLSVTAENRDHLSATMPANVLQSTGNILTIEIPTARPATANDPGDDGRELGIQVVAITFSRGSP